MYISCLSLLSLLIVIAKKENYKKVYLMSFFIILTPLLIIDETIGTDALTYKRMYMGILEQKISFNLVRSGILLKYLYYIMKIFEFSFFSTRIFGMIFIVSSFYISINNIFQTKDLLRGIFFLFSTGILLNYTLNGYKQGLAMGLFYLSIFYYLKNKNKNYIILNLIGILIHNLLIFPALIIRIKLVKLKYVIALFILTLLIGNYFKEICLFLIRFIPNFSYYLHYLKEDAYGVAYNWFNFLEYQFVFVILLYLDWKKRLRQKNKFNFTMINGFYYQIFLCNLLINYKVAMYRIVSFFSIFQIYVYCIIIRNLISNPLKQKLVTILIGILFFIVRVNKLQYFINL